MPSKHLTLLHTSDWHLGRSLHNRPRYDEFQAFLKWLGDTIDEQNVDVLLVAGDVFDTSAPGNRAQTLYYQFLARMAGSRCRHVVVIAGNHDSASFLNAPQHLLSALNVHVVGQACADPADEVLVLNDRQGTPEVIVCAVPYLRDRDIRTAQPGEKPQDKERKLLEGIRSHYAQVASHAATLRQQLQHDADNPLPVIGMGHLFTAGGVAGDGVRDLYVGSLAHVAAGTFAKLFDYLALGHLHIPQAVAGIEHIRYSGSPIAMGFGEAAQQKSVCLVRCGDGPPQIELIDVPVFQVLKRLRGDLPALQSQLRSLRQAGSHAWLEVSYDGQELIPDLPQRLGSTVDGSALQLLRIRNERIVGNARVTAGQQITLDELTPGEVFEQRMDRSDIPASQREGLLHTFGEAMASLNDTGLADNEPTGSEPTAGLDDDPLKVGL